MLQHVTASFAAGVVSSAVSTPADVVKTRLMNQAGHTHEYSGVVDAFVGITRQEGECRLLLRLIGFPPAACLTHKPCVLHPQLLHFTSTTVL